MSRYFPVGDTGYYVYVGNRFAPPVRDGFFHFPGLFLIHGGFVADILLLCGKVGSGKTFYADRLDSSGDFFKLSCDDLMLTLFDSCIGPDRHADMLSRCKEYLAGVALRLLNTGRNVVLDYGFWSFKERQENVRFFSSAGHKVHIIYFDTDRKTAVNNLNARNTFLRTEGVRGYIIDDNMKSFFDSKFEDPLPEEGAVTAFSMEDTFCRSID